jgi:hypothetical protein
LFWQENILKAKKKRYNELMTTNYTPIDDLIKKKLASHIGSIAKESISVPSSKEISHIQEAVEHEPSDEVKPFIEVKPHTIKLPPDLKTIGLQPVATTQFPTYQNIKLPLSDDKIIIGLQAPFTSSLRWLATLAIYILAQAHLGLRRIHGKVLRVVKR